MSMDENCLCVLVVTKTAKVSVSVSGVGLGLGLPGLDNISGSNRSLRICVRKWTSPQSAHLYRPCQLG